MQVDIDLVGVAALVSAVGTVALGLLRLLRGRSEEKHAEESASVIGMLADRIRELEHALYECKSRLERQQDTRRKRKSQLRIDREDQGR